MGVQDDDDEIIEPLNLDAGETARTDAAAAAAAQLTAAAALAGQAGLGSLAAAAAAAGAGRGGPGRGRGRRGRGRHRDRVHQRSLSEMSVRGLDLLRYATLAPDGTYRCIECERLQMAKNFKNKYSCKYHFSQLSLRTIRTWSETPELSGAVCNQTGYHTINRMPNMYNWKGWIVKYLSNDTP